MANSYWRTRELEHIEKTIMNDQQVVNRLSDKYQDAMEEIQEQIDAFYGRYAGSEGLTMKEARKRVAKADVEKYERKAKRYVKNRTFTQRANEEMRLYNVTMRINRLELLKANIRLELIALTSESQNIIYVHLTDSVRAEYARQAGILSQSLSYPAATVESIVNASFLTATWSDRIWDNQDALRVELDRLINRGIIQGQNPRVLARELRKKFDASVYDSERLLRTEVSVAQTRVQEDSYKKSGFEQYEYIAESTACDQCKPLDGKIFDVDKMEIGVNAPSIHPNCLCSTAAYMDREAFERDLEERGI